MLLACAHGTPAVRAASSAAAKSVKLALPSNDASSKQLLLQVTVGALPDGSRVIVSYENGEVAGSVAPYGHVQASTGGVFDVPIRRSAVTHGTITLRLEIEERRSGSRRAPSADEVRRLELVSRD